MRSSRRPSNSLRRSAAASATALLLTLGATTLATPATAATTVAHDDFNGDGYRDLVVSAPSGTVSGKKAAGYVAVLYGSKTGISTARKATFSLSTAGVPGTAQASDGFGQATASADLDGDGYADLVVGIPGKDIGTAVKAGAAVVLYGSKSGLRGTGSTWMQDDTPTTDGAFAMGLVTGRFLASETELTLLTSTSVQTYDFQSSPGVRSTPALVTPAWRWLEKDYTTAGFTSGDYNKDGYTDLVLLRSVNDIGADSYGVADERLGGNGGWKGGDRLISGGTVGASGDINKDGYADLVLGSPAELDTSGHLSNAGIVWVYLGGRGNLRDVTGANRQFFTQNTSGVPGVNKDGDRFGGAVSVGDINGDGYADVAIGAPGNDIGSATDAGTVWVMRGSAKGLTTKGVRTLSQDSTNVPGSPEKADQFGSALRLIDTNHNGKAELVASAPGENGDDGAAWVFPATSAGLATKGSWSFGATALHTPLPDARFGETLAP